ncbi:MAG: hypothetical protein MZV63_31415 [Marinilabiliales bacterium]|nr:hypothetical protein [Marinilabiliales bacterium]
MNNDRREFLKKGLLVFLPLHLFQGDQGFSSHPLTPATPAELPSRVLGRTGIGAPLASLGASGTAGRHHQRRL